MEPSERSQANIPTTKIQRGGLNREVLSKRSEPTHAKRTSCINSGWGRTGVSSKKWFLCLLRYIRGDTSLDRTCIKHTEKNSNKQNRLRTHTSKSRGLARPSSTTISFHISKKSFFFWLQIFVPPRFCPTGAFLHWYFPFSDAEWFHDVHVRNMNYAEHELFMAHAVA
jgi:hypothetical protein